MDIANVKNTMEHAKAISVIFDIVYAANTDLSNDKQVSKEAAKKALDTIAELGGVLGLFAKTEEKPLDEEIEAMIEERNKARAEKNWAKADEIRDKLKEMHIVLKDTPMGVKWSYEE